MDTGIKQILQTDPAAVTLLWDSNYSAAVTRAIRAAQKSIYITTFKMEPKKGPKAQRINELLSQLVSANNRGLDVRVLLNFQENKKSTSSINWYAANALRKRGLCPKYIKKKRTLHAKIILIDSDITITGSHNWSVMSHYRNIELSLILKSETINKEIKNAFLHFWDNSAEFMVREI